MNKIFMVLVMIMTSLVLVMGPTAPAHAVEGCHSKVVLKADTWGNNVSWMYPKRPTVPGMAETRIVGTTAYWYCPNGSRVDKIKPKWVQWCWTWMSDPVWWFDGVKFNGYWADDNTTSNPPGVKVPDDETIQNCRVQDIDSELERWLKMSQSPAWTISSWIVRHGMPDEHWDMRTNMRDTRSTIKYFHPLEDVNIGRWHR